MRCRLAVGVGRESNSSNSSVERRFDFGPERVSISVRDGSVDIHNLELLTGQTPLVTMIVSEYNSDFYVGFLNFVPFLVR